MPNEDAGVGEWTIRHFSQSNPAGPGQGSVPALLRRVAETIEKLGPNVLVEDITFSSQPTGDERDLTVTVYFNRVEDDEPVEVD